MYNHSGTNVSAARVDRSKFQSRFIVDVKLYAGECRSEQEALYLTAILNSETVNLAIKPFQSVGLQGERDIHKKLLELPIPGYVGTNALHAKLVALASEAERQAATAYQANPPATRLAARRAATRTALTDSLAKIDKCVRELLSTAHR